MHPLLCIVLIFIFTLPCVNTRKLIPVLFLLLLGSINIASAQHQNIQKTIDSLQQELQAAPHDTNQLLLMSELAKTYMTVNLKKADTLTQQAIALAEELNWDKGRVLGLIDKGSIDYKREDLPNALLNYEAALLIADSANLPGQKAKALHNIGNVYTVIGNYEKSVQYYQRSIDISRSLGNDYELANTTNNLAKIYIYKGEYETAIANFTKALEVQRDFKGKQFLTAITYDNIGYTYLLQKDYTKTIEYCQKALQINMSVGNKFRASENANNLSEAYLALTDYKNSVKYAQQSINLLEDIANPLKISFGYMLLAKAYQGMGDYKSAINAFKEYDRMKDSVISRRNTEQIEKYELKSAFEREQIADSIKNAQEQQLAADKLQRQKLISYAGVAVALILIVLSLFIAKERKKSDKLLLNILPAEVAKELKSRGATTAQHFDEVTVLFTDFVNFTIAGERMGATALVEELHSCFKAFDGIISKYGIEKIKTVGDAYLAVAGLPTANPNHAAQIIKAAQEIKAFMLERRQRLGDNTFEVRIGVHSGDVVAGIVGVKKFAYDVWGDTVNTAARMEQNSLPGKINISETTYNIVKDKIACTYRGELSAKNKGELKMYFVDDE